MYATVLIPIAQQSCYTYYVPENLQQQLQIGQQVIVPLGKKFYGGIVLKYSHKKPDYPTKTILSIWDNKAVVAQWQLDFWKWIADYYLCELGEVMAAALPAGFRIESEHLVQLIKPDYTPCSDAEALILKELQNNILELKALEEAFSGNLTEIGRLLEKNVVQLHTRHSQKFKAKEVVFLYLDKGITTSEIENLTKLQQHVLLRLMDLAQRGKVAKQELLQESGVTLSPINTLIKNGFIHSKKESVYREIFQHQKEPIPLHKLSEAQSKALLSIQDEFENYQTVLLHGVTSSGKTEIYTHLIAEQLQRGNTVLFLLPEIALTTQLANRLATFFGKQVLVYHSKYSNNERVEIWKKLQANKVPYLVIGARSAVFLPFSQLGLVIVDEEHEPGFKQQDPAPRYHGRDAAIYLAHLQKCKVLLGSATPALESYFNVHLKKYGLVTLTQRYQNIQPPEIFIINSAEAARKKQMKGIFTPQLRAAIQETLDKGEQVMLFQNRRGYAYFVKCKNCDNIPHCPHCDVSLSLHKYSQTLQCHYCNFSVPYHNHSCEECQQKEFIPIGFGTEQIEEQTAALFPEYTTDRIDWDTTTGKHNYQKILSRFAKGQTDILIGTQMLAKGLDFANVGLVAVLNADLLLHFPDFRAYERSFQLLLQVSGRAGRKYKQGKVLIQTYKPKHPILKLVQKGDYLSLYHNQINERSKFCYPPVYRIITLRLKHKNKAKVYQAAELLGENLKAIFKHRTYGAHTPLVSRVKTYYLQEIFIKIERKASYGKAKKIIAETIQKFKSTKGFSSVRIGADVDVY